MIQLFFLIIHILIIIYQYKLDVRGNFIINPKNLFQIYYIIQLPFSLFIGTNFSVPGFVYLSQKTDQEELFFLSVLFLFNHILFLIGYYLFRNFKSQKIIIGADNWQKKQTNLIIISLIAFGYFSFYYLLEINGGYFEFIKNRESWRAGGMVGQGIYIYPSTTLLVIASISFILNNKSWFNSHSTIKFLFVAFISILPASQLGFRSLILLPLLSYLFIYSLMFKKIPLNKSILSLSLIVIIFTIYGIYREASFVIDKISFDKLLFFAFENPHFIFYIFLRSKGADVFYSIYEKVVNNQDYQLLFSSLYESLTIIIPSSLWPSKPESLIVRFANDYFQLNGGVSPTILGEVFWHVGLFGTFIVFVFIGIVFKIFWNMSLSSVRKKSNILFLSIIFPSMIMSAETIQGYLNGAVMTYIVCTFLCFLFSIKIKRYE